MFTLAETKSKTIMLNVILKLFGFYIISAGEVRGLNCKIHDLGTIMMRTYAHLRLREMPEAQVKQDKSIEMLHDFIADIESMKLD